MQFCLHHIKIKLNIEFSYWINNSQLHCHLIILYNDYPKHTLRCSSIIVNDCKLAQHSASVRENGLIYFSNLSNVGNGYEIKMRLHIIFHKSPFVARPTMINSLYPIKYSINEWYLFIHIFIAVIGLHDVLYTLQKM